MQEAFEESDLRAGIKAGGAILGAFIVARSEEAFVIYIRANWGLAAASASSNLAGTERRPDLQEPAICLVLRLGAASENSTYRDASRSIRLATASCASSWGSFRGIWMQHRKGSGIA